METLTVGIYGYNAVLFREQLPPEPSINYELSPEVCDVAVVIDDVASPTPIRCREGYVWKITMEPHVKGWTPFAIKHPRVYSRVFAQSNFRKDTRVELSPPGLPWLVSGSYEELQGQGDSIEKSEIVSLIASTKDYYPGHSPRTELANAIENHDYGIAVFGKGRRAEVEDKRDALDKYMFSFAIENSQQDNYWTEKITDCFLTYTVPIYYGAPNIGSYFPEDSFISLGSLSIESVLEVLDELDENDYEKRLPALKEARKLYLEHYLFYAFLNNEINISRGVLENQPLRSYVVKPVRTYRDWRVTKVLRFFKRVVISTIGFVLRPLRQPRLLD